MSMIRELMPNTQLCAHGVQDKSGTLMMLPTDLALVKDEAFLPYVQKYSKDKKAFYSDFSDAFQKLEELGTSGLKPVSY